MSDQPLSEEDALEIVSEFRRIFGDASGKAFLLLPFASARDTIAFLRTLQPSSSWEDLPALAAKYNVTMQGDSLSEEASS